MKKVIVIGSRDSGNKNDPSEIARSIRSGATDTSLLYWEDMSFDIVKGNVYITVDGDDILSIKPDLVIAMGWYKNGKKAIYRDVAFALALVLRHHGITFWNSEMANQRSTTKLSTMVQLALNGVSVPRTLFSLSFDNVASQLHYPFIAKAASASRGDMNYLVDGDAVLANVRQAGSFFLVQEFLPNDHDLRFICFDGRPALVLRRARPADANSHLNNTSQGGMATWLKLADINSDVLTNIEKICRIMGREMAGVDLIPDSSSPLGYSCLEVNAIPQLTSGTDSNIKLAALAEALRVPQGDVI